MGTTRPFSKVIAIAFAVFYSAIFFSCAELENKLKSLTEVIESDSLSVAAKGFKSKGDELLAQNKGKAVVEGVILRESDVPNPLAKTTKYSNAAGLSKKSANAPVPLGNADVMFYNALAASSKAAYHTQSDDSGRYYAVLSEGKFFAFAIKFDPTTQELITARIDNIKAKKDSVVKMDSTSAAEDKISPTITSIYNATTPDKNSGLYLVTGIPNEKPTINIVFSEPMLRSSATGLVIGTVDSSAENGVFALTDTVKSEDIKTSWNGDNTVLNLKINKTLKTDVQYGLYIPKTLKDMAKNGLEEKAQATFMPVEASELEDFKIAETYPKGGGKIKPNQNPAIVFTRPVEIISVLNNIQVEPDIPGNWEVRGSKAVFKQKRPFKVGNEFKISASKEVKDIGGKQLKEALAFKFKVKEFSGAAAKGGDVGVVAQKVEDLLDAFTQGDIPRFASLLSPNFRMFEDGKLIGKDEVIDQIRRDVAERDQFFMGIQAPVFDNDKSACDNNIKRWQVGPWPRGKKGDILWVQTDVPPGASRKVFKNDKGRTEIDATEIKWDMHRPEFKYKNLVYRYEPDFSNFHGPMTAENAEEDEFFFADLLRRSSSVILKPVKASVQNEFFVDPGVKINGDSAKVAAKEERIEKPDRTDFDPEMVCSEDAGKAHTERSLLNFVVLKEKGQWSIIFLTFSELKDMKAEVKYDEAFKDFEDFSQILPLELLSPVKYADKVADKDGNIELKFESIKKDKVGGYLVGLAEDPWFIANRPPYGALFFVKADKAKKEISFKVDKNGKPVKGGGATAIVRRAQDMGLPGWERTMFEFTLDELVNFEKGLAGVYFWKAIAIEDTSAAQFLKNGFTAERFIAESDFKFNPEYGHFAVKHFPSQGEMEGIFMNQGGPGMPGHTGPGGPHMPMGFNDMDVDGFPDDLERMYGTDPNNRSSYPDFTLDSDADGMADFLEEKLDKDGKKDLVNTPASAEDLKKQWEALGKAPHNLKIIDDDKDGFPNNIEEMMGFDPFNKHNRPGTRARVKAPTGVFSGKIAFGGGEQDRFPVTIKIIKDSLLSVKYTAVFKEDTLTDSVGAVFEQGIGELMFTIRFESGPDAGNSLLMRGNFDQGQGLLQGPVDMIPSPKDKFDTRFPGGPYMGQWAATNKIGVNVDNFLHFGPVGPGPVGPGGPNPMGPGPLHMTYREPPQGTFPEWKFIFKTLDGNPPNQTLAIVNDFGDTVVLFKAHHKPQGPEDKVHEGGHIMFHPNPEGFHIEAEYFMHSPVKDMKVHAHGELFRGPVKDSTGKEVKAWIFDGGYSVHEEKCQDFGFKSDGSIDSNICMRRNFYDKPGQFSAWVPEGEFKVQGDPQGTLTGWSKEDEHGTGFVQQPDPGPNTGPGNGDRDGDCIPDMEDPEPDNHDMPMPGGKCGPGPIGPGPGFGAPPYIGNPKDFMNMLPSQWQIARGDTFNIKVIGEEMVMKTVFDTNHIIKSFEPECGNFVRIIPIGDKAEKFDQLKLDDKRPYWGMQLLLLESHPGMPSFKDKVRDQNGAVVENVFETEPRGIHGEGCKDGMGGPGMPGPGGPGPGGTTIPDALSGRVDEIGPGTAFKPFTGGRTEFFAQVKKYLGRPADEPVLSMNIEVMNTEWMHTMTFGGKFQEEDGMVIHRHDFPWHDPTGMWTVAASNHPERKGDIAVAIAGNGPAVILIPKLPIEKNLGDLKPIRGDFWMVNNYLHDIFRSPNWTVHIVDSGKIIETRENAETPLDNFKADNIHTQLIIHRDDNPDNSPDYRFVVLNSTLRPGNPALGVKNGVPGLLLGIYSVKDLIVMGGSGPGPGGIDMDGDCVEDKSDPDPRNPDNPVPGGKCVGPGFEDRDGDCIEDENDPNPDDPDKPFVGGKCVKDMDGDCVEDEKDPYPNNPEMPFPGGDCGFKDFDGDCIDDKEDPNPNDFNIPKNGGACGDVQDNDKDCVPDMNDPDPANPNVPEPGGACDRDGDCIPDSKDPSPDNPDLPEPGGVCGKAMDNDKDCVPDDKDPDPANPNIPFVGGQCVEDKDNDCVPDKDDPDPANPDVPFNGGNCGGPKEEPNLYRGDMLKVQAALRASNNKIWVFEGENDQTGHEAMVTEGPFSQPFTGHPIIVVKNESGEELIILGIGPEHRQVFLFNNMPTAVKANTGSPTDPSPKDPEPDEYSHNPAEYTPYRGDLPKVEAALNAKNEFVRLIPGSEPKVRALSGKTPFKNPDGTVSIHDPNDGQLLIFLAPVDNESVLALEPATDRPLTVTPPPATNNDKDGDCIPDDEDPSPDNKDLPEPGGKCETEPGPTPPGPDRDGDCIPDDKDPSPDNPDLPEPGGKCGTEPGPIPPGPDRDGDCIPDDKDPSPDNPDLPEPGGICSSTPL